MTSSVYAPHLVRRRRAGCCHVHLEDVGALCSSSALVLPLRLAVSWRTRAASPRSARAARPPRRTCIACTGGVRRTREDVAPDGRWPSVGVALRDGDVGDHVGQHVDLGRLQRQRVERRITGDGEVRPFGLRVRRRRRGPATRPRWRAKAQIAKSTRRPALRPLADSGGTGWRKSGKTGPRTRRMRLS